MPHTIFLLRKALLELCYLMLLCALHIVRVVMSVVTGSLQTAPKPLNFARTRVPKRLAVILKDAEERDCSEVVNSLLDVQKWCEGVGVEELSVYDRRGVLKSQYTTLQRLLSSQGTVLWSPSPSPEQLPIELPPSPPSSSKPSPPSSIDGLSDAEGVTTVLPSHIQSKSGQLRRRAVPISLPINNSLASGCPLKINILSYADSKPAIARAALSLSLQALEPTSCIPSLSDIDSMLQTEWSAPDVVLVHSMKPRPWWALLPEPLELDGFPPWHIHLSEIYHDPPPRQRWPWPPLPNSVALRQEEFEHALQGYEKVEMRLGR